MLFSSPIFIFLFLPLVLALYFIVPTKTRNLLLLIASLVFYFWGERAFGLIMIGSITLNYISGRLIGPIAKFKKGMRRRGFYFITAIVLNLFLLAFFKYGGFFLHNLHVLLGHYVPGEYFFSHIHLPLGISFFTFHAISYLFDIYRGKVTPQKKVIQTALYISFFPQLIAGPIVRYHDVSAQLVTRVVSLEEFSAGIERFILGLGKKVLIANVVGSVADQIFSLPPNQLGFTVSWLGIICYTLQIYFDFSGYSDMAIGLAKMFGFEFLENFNYPYISKSITEFWRRWHISLSNWFRDYLYIPLGGNRLGNARTYFNLMVVFLLCGLWHGASWTFVVWGIWHGSFLVIERLFSGTQIKIWNPVKHVYSIFIVIIGWVFFRSPSLGHAVGYLENLFNLNYHPLSQYSFGQYVNSEVAVALGLAILISMPVYPKLQSWIIAVHGWPKEVYSAAYTAVLFLIFGWSVIFLASNTYNPFIYFRF